MNRIAATLALLITLAPALAVAQDGWLYEHPPKAGETELSLYGGLLLPNENLELFEASLDKERQGFKPYESIAPTFGLRVGYFPWTAFGFEFESGASLAEVEGGEAATLWTARAHGILQYDEWSFIPFLVVGGGFIGVSSGADVVGADSDPQLHIGVGSKFNLTDTFQFRIDLRDNITPVAEDAGLTNNFEALASIGIRFGGDEEEVVLPPTDDPKDTDGDGLLDPDDKCPNEPENKNGIQDEDGCPEPDTDGDGIVDPVDSCVEEPETVNDYKDEDGCPETDTDGDGYYDDQDECPKLAGKRSDGCPDRDGDGIIDPKDSCPDEPETKNGYQDEDGCPDTVPKEMKDFTGVIEGITFATGKDTIRQRSTAKLSKAVTTLKKFPSIRVLISGHTDDVGTDDYNNDLSKRRADAVKAWLVSKGIDAKRIETAGFGKTRPRATGKSKAARAQNRRIEFEIISK
jgi:outer membrane protein OmpA-like peptidoglycan-associated protein